MNYGYVQQEVGQSLVQICFPPHNDPIEFVVVASLAVPYLALGWHEKMQESLSCTVGIPWWEGFLVDLSRTNGSNIVIHLWHISHSFPSTMEIEWETMEFVGEW